MGAVKAWAMDHEELVGEAMESGAKSVADVQAYVKTHMTLPVDNRYVEELCIKFWQFDGYPQSMTKEQIQDLDNQALSNGWV